jgi:hypothetical protein
MYNSVICSPFVEHPFVDVAQFDAGAYDLTIFEEGQASNFLIKGQFNKEQYCKCLLHKLFSIPKSKIKPFIQYQCDKMQEPIVWLNKLEKLIDLNRELFTTKDQVIKFEKALMIIEVMRDVIEQKSQKIDIKFNFVKLKSDIKEYQYEEKISCLMEAQAEYLQNKPKLIDPTETPFDEKCSIEIDKIEKLERLKKRTPEPANIINKQPLRQKIVIRGYINVLVDAFYQMLHEKKVDGLSYLDVTTPELIQFITSNFLDKDGQPLSESTVRTILTPNRPEKRPKNDNKIIL